MNMGQRIKFFRKRRGMTQTQLGVAAGMPAANADVRISQYESGERRPKEGLRVALADALGVNPLAISDPDLNSPEALMHLFFMLEDQYGIHISKCHSQIYLAFDQNKIDGDLKDMILKWSVANDMVTLGFWSKELYDDWRYNFSGNHKMTSKE